MNHSGDTIQLNCDNLIGKKEVGIRIGICSTIRFLKEVNSVILTSLFFFWILELPKRLKNLGFYT